ncbi:hypothetical protein Scep_013591 [Stephania cephalantha]|uniref:Uncharacterized protein n=1 Tax=Stephania cephalantha TaxID=152367 RepID=A0AAP0P7R3_9MAGN
MPDSLSRNTHCAVGRIADMVFQPIKACHVSEKAPQDQSGVAMSAAYRPAANPELPRKRVPDLKMKGFDGSIRISKTTSLQSDAVGYTPKYMCAHFKTKCLASDWIGVQSQCPNSPVWVSSLSVLFGE